MRADNVSPVVVGVKLLGKSVEVAEVVTITFNVCIQQSVTMTASCRMKGQTA